ncbi:MAG: DUF1177 domain-containing protein [Candidatus Methanomethylicia archaeon]|nr:DUF1177 domain-containing protein [Candidatus Methanomethylicia archaeon]MCX8169016.1 DUF1177 domain-containing protein [Candidatus Methanomethylicia archaeon]
MEAIEILEDANVNSLKVKKELEKRGVDFVEEETIYGERGKTDFIKIGIIGREGKINNGNKPTLGIIGRLGGLSARPQTLGLVSDADGAIVAIASAMKLADLKKKGDVMLGDVIITTHICPNAPTKPHKPVPFMSTPVEMYTLIMREVDEKMDAILSVDATKGNRIIKVNGFAITPTIVNGWILKVSDDLINIYERVTGHRVYIVPITMQDITPYVEGIYHINSIVQPWIATRSPVVGVAITTEVPIAGCATGATYIWGLEQATRFCIEVAKDYTTGLCKFYDEEEYKKLLELYGDMERLRGKFSFKKKT